MAALDAEAMSLLGDDPADAAVEVMRFGRQADAAVVGGAFDAADRYDRSLALWYPPVQSADRDSLPEKQLLDSRSRDSLRNDAYVRGGAAIQQDSVVGSLYALNAKPALRALGSEFDETFESEFQEETETLFSLFAESPENWLDASRTNTFTELVRLAVGMNVATGEVLASVEWLRDFGRPFNTAIQFIDPDRLSNPNHYPDTMNIRRGVQKNKYGAPIGYHIQMTHPSDYMSPTNWRWKFVRTRKPWGRLQMIHILEQHRPDQSRGIAEMVSALKEIRITKKFRDVVLQNAVVNATYAASIESDMPPAEAFAALGGSDNPAEGLNQFAAHYLDQIAQYTGAAKNLSIDGVRIPHLYPGTKLNLHKAGEGGPLGTEFEQSLLRYIAASLGVSYEQLARDYSKTNYSSARAALAETWKRMAAIKRMVADRFANSVYRLWLEEAIQKGLITSLPARARSDGWLYQGMNLDAIARAEWIGASKGQIDELKETQAAILRLRHGLSTLEIEAGRLGRDWRALTRQQAREMEARQEAGLPTSVEDNTVNAISGDPREAEGVEGESND